MYTAAFASERRHASGRLRARCGSTAQQSCEPATALGVAWPKTSKIEARGGYPIGFWDQKWSKFRSWVLLWLLACLGGVLGASWGRFGTVLSGSWVPTWVPKRSQLGQKIDPKIDHFLDASWNRFLGGFCWILGAKMEPSWYQNGIKNRFLRKHEKTHLELAR